MRTRTIVVATTALMLNGCISVPVLEQDGIAVTEIVQRVKCELAYAIPDVAGKYPTGDFQWLAYWTAKIDLTLEVTDTASMVPTVSFIEPMKPAALPGIGSFQQSFTFGAAANVTGTAYRNDKVSFTVSILEASRMKVETECDLPHRLGIMGRLGLEEWVRSALGPVANRKLDVGYHEPPTGKSVKIFGPSPPAKDKSSGEKNAPALTNDPVVDAAIQDLQKADANLSLAYQSIAYADKLLARAQDKLEVFESVLKRLRRRGRDALLNPPNKRQIQRVYQAAEYASGNADEASDNIDQAKLLVSRATADAYRARDKLLKPKQELEALRDDIGLDDDQKAQLGRITAVWDKIKDDYLKAERPGSSDPAGVITKAKTEIDARAKADNEAVTGIKKIASSNWELMPRDPPLDSIAHTVKFNVVAGANVNPNWSLVKFKGPGQGNSPFASAQRTRQHTLDLVLGAPATPGGKELSDEQSRQLLNLRLDRTPFLIPGF